VDPGEAQAQSKSVVKLGGLQTNAELEGRGAWQSQKEGRPEWSQTIKELRWSHRLGRVRWVETLRPPIQRPLLITPVELESR